MKVVLIICSLITIGMVSTSINSYVRYYEAEEAATQGLNMMPDFEFSDGFVDSDIDTTKHEWYNDEDYLDTVVIPMQQDKYNLHNIDSGLDNLQKHFICIDTKTCELHDSMYDKSNQAKDIKIQLIKINSTLDSMENKY